MILLQTKSRRNPFTAGKLPREEVLRVRGKHRCITLQLTLLIAFTTLSSLSWGESLGRLFFTPVERSNLDRDRLSGGIGEHEGAAALQTESLTLNGIVKRSSGKTTVWINNLTQNESDLPPESRRLAGRARLPNFPVLVQKTGKTVTLKVGQTLNIDSGEIRENYQAPRPRKEVPPAMAYPAATAAANTPASSANGASPLNQS